MDPDDEEKMLSNLVKRIRVVASGRPASSLKAEFVKFLRTARPGLHERLCSVLEGSDECDRWIIEAADSAASLPEPIRRAWNGAESARALRGGDHVRAESMATEVLNGPPLAPGASSDAIEVERLARGRAMAVHASLAVLRCDDQRAIRWLSDARPNTPLARTAGILVELAAAQIRLRRHDDARTTLDRAFEFLQFEPKRARRQTLEAMALSARGIVEAEAGATQRAIELHRAALAVAERAGEQTVLVDVGLRLADGLMSRGDLIAAEIALAAISPAVVSLEHIGMLARSRGWLAMLRGERREAIRIYAELLNLPDASSPDARRRWARLCRRIAEDLAQAAGIVADAEIGRSVEALMRDAEIASGLAQRPGQDEYSVVAVGSEPLRRRLLDVWLEQVETRTFIVDFGRKTLTRRVTGEIRQLTNRDVAILKVLAQRRGELVSKAEIFAALKTAGEAVGSPERVKGLVEDMRKRLGLKHDVREGVFELVAATTGRSGGYELVE